MLLLYKWWCYVDIFIFQTDQKIRNLDAAKAHLLTADDPDYATRDLYNAISNKEFPSWSVKIQVMTFEQAEKFRWNPFDLTKVQKSKFV